MLRSEKFYNLYFDEDVGYPKYQVLIQYDEGVSIDDDGTQEQ